VESDDEQAWLTPLLEETLSVATPGWLPDASVALYARWWQLETWLRDLIYVELRALRGSEWVEAVRLAVKRQELDAEFTHMAGPDNANPLAYLDYSQLLEIIDANWKQFGYALVRKSSWDGRQDDLRQIRHRIGHMRRPHRHDLNRLEQTLNDVERGVFAACLSYNDGWTPDPDEHDDAVTTGWVAGEHLDAQRLITHAEGQYGVRVRVSVSKRPWASQVATLDGASGYLWHADFYLRHRSIDLPDLWRDIARSPVIRRLTHLGTDDPNHLRFTFSAGDPAESIADAIGSAFDHVLMNLAFPGADFVEWNAYQRRARALDWRIQSGSPWTIADESTVPFSAFGAGGGVSTSTPG
jgi:hypothetical protein